MRLTRWIDASHVIPTLPESQRWVELKRPELDSTCEHRRVVFGQKFCRDGLLGLDAMDRLPEMVNRGKRDLIYPRLALL